MFLPENRKINRTNLISVDQSKYWGQKEVLQWPAASVGEKIIKLVRQIRRANLLFALISFNRKASVVIILKNNFH
jgi:hypothetical protein